MDSTKDAAMVMLNRLLKQPEKRRGIPVLSQVQRGDGSQIMISFMGGDALPLSSERTPAALSAHDCALALHQVAEQLDACRQRPVALDVLIAQSDDAVVMARIDSRARPVVTEFGSHPSLSDFIGSRGEDHRHQHLHESLASRVFSPTAFGYVPPESRAKVEPIYEDLNAEDFMLIRRVSASDGQGVIHIPSGLYLGKANDFVADPTSRILNALRMEADRVAPGLAEEQGAYSKEEKEQIARLIKEQLMETLRVGVLPHDLLKRSFALNDLPYGGLMIEVPAFAADAPAFRSVIIEYDRAADLYNLHCMRMNGFEFEHVCTDQGLYAEDLAPAIRRANWPTLDARHDADNDMRP